MAALPELLDLPPSLTGRTRRPPAWADYERLVCHWAWAYARKCPAADVRDLIAAGRLAYAEALGSWDPARGALSTHLVWKVRERMSAWIAAETRFFRAVRTSAANLPEPPKGEARNLPTPEPFLPRLLERLDEEARELVAAVLAGERLPARARARHACAQVRAALRELKYA